MRHPRHPHHHDSPFGVRHGRRPGSAARRGAEAGARGEATFRTALLRCWRTTHARLRLIRELEQRSGGRGGRVRDRSTRRCSCSRTRGSSRARSGTASGLHDHRRGPGRARGAPGARGRRALGVRAARRGARAAPRGRGHLAPRPCRSRARVRRPAKARAEILADARKRSTRCSPRTDGTPHSPGDPRRPLGHRAEGHPRLSSGHGDLGRAPGSPERSEV